MATQGLITVVNKKGETHLKCVAGCNGSSINKVSDLLLEITKTGKMDIDEVYSICLENDFGCEDCLIVQNGGGFKGNIEDLPSLYIDKFNDPSFNPRWERGSADYHIIIYG